MMQRPGMTDRSARVLIVDDDLRNRELLKVMLAGEQYILQTAASGPEALAMVARDPPDLVLLDVMMPDMDGNEVAIELKENAATRHIPIIMVTALDHRNDRMRALKAGAEDFLTKPVDRAELCVRVRNLLRLKAYSDYHDTYSQMLEREVGWRTADLVERTDSLQQQGALLAEQAALLDLAPDAIVVRDMDDRILFWNRGAEMMYGWSKSEALGRVTYDLHKTEFPQPLDEILGTLTKEGHWQGEVVHYTRFGARLDVSAHWSLQTDAAGAPMRIFAINTDITARKRTEANLLALTERLSLATAVARVGVWDWDLTTNTLTWDPTMFEIYGRAGAAHGNDPWAPMPYTVWSSAVHPEDLAPAEAVLLRVIEEKGEGSAEFRIILPDGTLKNISGVERVVLGPEGNVCRVIGVNMDITERKAAEAAAHKVRTDQMRFKDEFLSHVSHELRSPLTAIKQFTSILLGGLAGELNAEQREYQEIVLRNIRQLQSMIDDLLEVTRLETRKLTVQPECVSVPEAVEDALETLHGPARAKGVMLTSRMDPDLPPAYADQIRLRQILIILLDNAIKFTPQGGTVTSWVRLLPENPRFLLLEVVDTGCGIDPDIAGRLFERLYQVTDSTQGSRAGLGLGLYICHELVTRHGGQITVRSQLRKGSTFSFTLPVFSLDTALAPLLKEGAWPARTSALVAVQGAPGYVWSSKTARSQWAHDVRNVVERCLMPNLDVLLPNMETRPDRDRFFVLAFADENGASVLVDRIREQFARQPRLTEDGIDLSISHTMLQPVPGPADASTEGIETAMATHVEAAIKAYISPAGSPA
jgi:PAS domain S-box-containing protein